MTGVDPRITHWGEAALLFSLDLAIPVTRVIFGERVDALALRDAMRQAILQNRQAVVGGMGPQYLRDLLAWAAPEAPWLADVMAFVDTAFVSVSLPEIGRRLPLGFMTQDEANRRISALLPPDQRRPDLRQRVLALLSQPAYEALFAAADAADNLLATRQTSTWDGEILARNVGLLSPADPLRNLLHSADLALREMAFREAVASLDDETREHIAAADRVAA